MVSLAITSLPERVHAVLAGALAGEELAGTATGAAQMLLAAESAASSGGFDEADLRGRGLDQPPASGPAGLLLRALPLLSPLDRPLLRRNAHRAATLGGGDAGTAITAVAAAVLCADLLRFDLESSLARLRQTLLEEAPFALLDRLEPLHPRAALAGDSNPLAALQIAITALARADTPGEVLAEVSAYADQPCASLSLAGALAGARRGLDPADAAWAASVPAAERVALAAEALASRATAQLG